MPQLVLADGVGMIDLVAQDHERHLGQVFHRQQRVQLGFGFRQAFVVFGVDQEDDAGYFGEVIFPEPAGCGRVPWLVVFVCLYGCCCCCGECKGWDGGELGAGYLVDGRRDRRS